MRGCRAAFPTTDGSNGPVLGKRSARDANGHPAAVEAQREDLTTASGDGAFDRGAGIGFDEQRDAASATRAVHFSCESTGTARSGDYAIDDWRADGWQIPATVIPLFLHQAPDFAPLPAFEGGAHGLRDLGNDFEIAEYATVAIYVRAIYFPIVDSRLARLAGVANHDAAFEFIEIDFQRFPADAAGLEMDGRGAAECRREMILRASGNFDDDGFDIAADFNPGDAIVAGMCQAIERGAQRHGHGAGAPNACAGGSFGIGRKRKSYARPKVAHQLREKRQPMIASAFESRKRKEALRPARVARGQLDAFAMRMHLEDTRSVTRDCAIHCYSALVIQVEWPDIERSAGEIYAGGCTRFNSHLARKLLRD